MKFDNHSAPYMSKNSETSLSTRLPSTALNTPTSSKFAIANIPPRPQYFSERKSDSGHSVPTLAYDYFRENQARPPGSSASSMIHGDMGAPAGRAESADACGPAAPSSWRAHESLRKLDGMLLQHMETEKDTIRRIATTAKQNQPASDGSLHH